MKKIDFLLLTIILLFTSCVASLTDYGYQGGTTTTDARYVGNEVSGLQVGFNQRAPFSVGGMLP